MHSAVKMLARLGRSGLFKRQFPQAGSKAKCLEICFSCKRRHHRFWKILCTYQCQAGGGGGGGGHRAGFWHFPKDCCQIPTPGQKCAVKYNQISHPEKWFVVTDTNKNSDTPTPWTARKFKCPTPGPKWSIKIPPYAPPRHPPSPSSLTLIGALTVPYIWTCNKY